MADTSGAGTVVARTKWAYIAISVFLTALGVCAVVWPDIGVGVICAAIGVAGVCYGVIRIIVYFLAEVRGIGLSYDFSIGLLCVAGGIILLIRPAAVVDLLQVVLGIYILIDSVFKLQTALDARRIGIPGWWIALIFTLVGIVFGILMVLKVGAGALMVMTGLALIADGLQNLCLVIFSAAAKRTLRKAAAGAAAAPADAGDDASAQAEDAPPAEAEAPSSDTEEGSMKL